MERGPFHNQRLGKEERKRWRGGKDGETKPIKDWKEENEHPPKGGRRKLVQTKITKRRWRE